MNHQSPRRPRGSLIERAAARFDFVPVPPLAEAAPEAAPERALPTGEVAHGEAVFAAGFAPVSEVPGFDAGAMPHRAEAIVPDAAVPAAGVGIDDADVAAAGMPDARPDDPGHAESLHADEPTGDETAIETPAETSAEMSGDAPVADAPVADAPVADVPVDDAPVGWEPVLSPRFLAAVATPADAEVPPLAALHGERRWHEAEAAPDSEACPIEAEPVAPAAEAAADDAAAPAHDDDGEVAWSDWGVVPEAAPEPEPGLRGDAAPDDAGAAEATAPDADWSPEDAEAAPLAQPRPGTINRAGLAARGMIVPGGGVTPLAEEFRLVKRQLLLAARAMAASAEPHASARARTILVCSARPGEGKTFCAINLALSMAAERDIEVLLVDADFPKPDVLGRLGLRPGPGLLDVLSGVVEDVESCIIRTDVPQLSVLPAGARSDSDTELVASERARALMEGLAAADPRRIVIFDSPPALAASPASVLALNVGQVLMVVRADRTAESDLRDAVALLDGCEHIQLLLNAVRYQPSGQRFGSYYGEVEA